ncbi:copper transpport protein [Elasticomyces elasticus]|nr:copper transpport protein [Elasticomyces elasticus]
MLLTAGYELVREVSRRYEESSSKQLQNMPNHAESSSLLYPGRNAKEVERTSKAIKAALYAVQVFYSFFIM